jgi:peptidoglycan/xylan/chitin deacetylase (PgdA/CDA1 family)
MKKLIKKFAKWWLATAIYWPFIVYKKKELNGIIILMFHKVSDKNDPLPLTIRPNLLDQILKEITLNYEIISINDINKHKNSVLNSSGLKFALTFDDGYRDNYINAFPVLKKYNVSATIYLSVNHINNKQEFWYEQLAHAIFNAGVDYIDLTKCGMTSISIRTIVEQNDALHKLNKLLKHYSEETRAKIVKEILILTETKSSFSPSYMLDWEMVREMKNDNITFGSHTLSHPILSRENMGRIREEINLSKHEIEKKIGESIYSFAYPNGTSEDFNDRIVREVELAGYGNACTTVSGVNTKKTGLFTLYRVNVHNSMCTNPRDNFSKRLFWAKILDII